MTVTKGATFNLPLVRLAILALVVRCPSTPPAMRRVFYGWIIVGAGFVIQFLNGGLLFHFVQRLRAAPTG